MTTDPRGGTGKVLNLPCKSPKKGHQPGEPDWLAYLPAEWRETVEPPLYFERYSEYEIRAERTVGYDADDQRCFTAHRYVLTSLASDDDEEFYELVTYSEEMAAWRLRDERWLVYRRISTNNCNHSRSFYALSPDMPR
jgi:hypothetical protein